MNAATHGFRSRLVVIALVAVGALAAILLATSAGPVEKAHAQSAAACPQYNANCVGNNGGGCHATNTCGGTNPGNNQGQNNQGRNVIQGGAGVVAGTVGGNGGKLPFTGYPLTPLILLLLVLLAAGLTIRAYLAVRDRSRSR